jgi:putative effector of murein hydrolase LrgA (UPF0299 family)
MQTTLEELRQRYESLTDIEIIRLSESDGLTEDALSVLREELSRRKITPKEIEKIKAGEVTEKIDQIIQGDIPSPPKIWIGFVLTAFLFLSEIINPNQIQDFAQIKDITLFMLFGLACLFCYFYIVMRIHYILKIISFGSYPISPSRAGCFHLIPIYGFFWPLKWSAVLSDFIRSHGDQKMLPGAIIGLVLFFSCVCMRLLDAALGFLFVFLTLKYINEKIKKQIGYSQKNAMLSKLMHETKQE